MINSFRTDLAKLSVDVLKSFLGNMPDITLAREVEGVKFDFLLKLWERLERSEEWGAKMRQMRKTWADLVFN